ncbi:hypothetical protein DVH24_028149 [Malus domestica]|uniref:Zinc finger C3HC4 RING-type domain-containing protein n=1 Tax=Malus domestica TaxID=3750 RepID=A0A498HDP5_MALDO|nr:hypothetical protein DVH24_028149 [Malus domestica]
MVDFVFCQINSAMVIHQKFLRMSSVVTVAPCFHNFCNGCFSEWLKRSQEKRSSVLYPQCRAALHTINLILNSEKHLCGKRARSQVDEEDDNASNPCPQCGNE